MVGTVNIIGQIGSTYAQDGSVAVAGVELAHVASQLAAVKDCEKVVVYINSPGGSVEIGSGISEMLAATPNCYTVAQGQCASIATKIFTSVPVENRAIEEGCEFMIHNPLFANISGNAAQLEMAASILKPLEADLLGHYVKATGSDKAILKPLMSAETCLSPEECVQLGFAGEVIPALPKAVAFLSDVNSNNSNMSTNSNFWENLKAKAKALGWTGGDGEGGTDPNGGADPNEGREAVALQLNTDQGVIETPYSDVMVGDPVMMVDTQQPAPDGTYVAEDGTTFVVAGGMVESITPVEGGDLSVILVAKEQEIETLKTTIGELTKQVEASAFVIEKLEAKAQRSSYKPNTGAVATFAKNGKTPGKESITKEALLARRESYKPKAK